MELLVFGYAGMRVIVFPTREGRFYDYENWRIVEAVRDSIEAGQLQLFCVDSLDSESLYCDRLSPPERIARHREYVNYITQEVVPFTTRRNDNPLLVAHGCSIGAYHAVNIAFRHPELFGRVVAFSGRYDLTRQVENFPDLFNGYYDQDIYFHTPTHFLPSLEDPSLLAHLRRLDITITVGEHDPFLDSSRQLSRILTQKGIGHRLLIWEGEAHRAYYWRQMAKLYLNGHGG